MFCIYHAPDAQVAQLVEQRTENPRVGGSNPPLGTTCSPPNILYFNSYLSFNYQSLTHS